LNEPLIYVNILNILLLNYSGSVDSWDVKAYTPMIKGRVVYPYFRVS